MRNPPMIAVKPDDEAAWLRPAVVRGGANLADSVGEADALVWGSLYGPGIKEVIGSAHHLRWIQLSNAGVDWLFRDGINRKGITWTSAKEVYGDAVAEAVLTLMLAGLRGLQHYSCARTWQQKRESHTLFGRHVVIVGGGGIGRSLLALLQPFRVRTTVVRLTDRPISNADRTVTYAHLDDELPGADIVILAAPLTPITDQMISQKQLNLMHSEAWLVNVGRGRLVDTHALEQALTQRSIGGAALDVTDPEPLPDDSSLWELPNCIITPHVAVPEEAWRRPLEAAVEENVRRFCSGRQLRGIVHGGLGY